MVERATVNETVQIGVEATPGTLVPANKKLQSVGFDLGVEADVRSYVPSGEKYVTVTALNKEWLSGSINGAPTYTELLYLLASAIGRPVTAVVQAGVVWKHTFTLDADSADDVVTFSIEQGSPVRAHRAAYGLVTALGLDISRDGVDLSGTLIARALTDGITMTATPTKLALVPILPTQWSVYLDPTFAAIGTTKQTRVLEASWSIGDRANPLWVVDAAQASWVAHVETRPTLEATIHAEADTQGMAHLDRLRDGATRYLRLEAVGPIIAGADAYRLRIDVPGKISAVDRFDDVDGVYGVDWTFAGVNDATATFPTRIELTTSIDDAAI